MGSRFVRPETKTVTLANGDTILVKRQLTRGERAAAFARLYQPNGDGQLHVNPLMTGMATVTAYLIDWNFTDDEGRRVEIRGLSVDDLTSVLDTLSPEDFDEVRAAIDAHVEVMAHERDALKNVAGGAKDSAAISPSPSAAA